MIRTATQPTRDKGPLSTPAGAAAPTTKAAPSAQASQPVQAAKPTQAAQADQVVAARTRSNPFVSTPRATTRTVASAQSARVLRPTVEPKEAPDSPLRAAFEALPGARGPGKARLLTDNAEAWASRWAMLDSATKTIDSTYFSIHRDVFGYAFLGHLLQKARQGVKIRLMTDAMADSIGVDGFKAPVVGKDYMQELADAGVGVRYYNPVSWRVLEGFKLGALASNHDKILAVDGVRSMTGGRNIGGDYFTQPSDEATAWRDSDVQLKGRAPAAGLTQAFEAEYLNPKVTKAVPPDLFGNWRSRAPVMLGACIMMDEWLKGFPAPQTPPQDTHEIIHALVAKAIERLPAEGVAKYPNWFDRHRLRVLAKQLVEHPGNKGSLTHFASADNSRPTEVRILDKTSAAGKPFDDIASSLRSLCEHAQKRILIENPYVVLTEPMIKMLQAAGKRGVQITIATNSPASTDSALTQDFFLRDWPNLEARIPNLHILVATGKRKFHAKTMVFDDEVSLVSSYNLDFISAEVNSEIGAAMWSKKMAGDLERAFEADKADPANGMLEYTIERDADGKPVLKDGKPVVTCGPASHLSAGILRKYAAMRWIPDALSALPGAEDLRHPSLADAASSEKSTA